MTIGSGVESAIAPKNPSMPDCVGLTYGGTTTSSASAPEAWASFAAAIVVRTSFVPTFAITVERSPAAAFTAATSSRRSPPSSVIPSPVDPATTRPSVPRLTSHVARRAASFASSAPDSLNGVIIAVTIGPRCFIALVLLEVEMIVNGGLSALYVGFGHENRNRDITVGGVDDLYVFATERLHHREHDARRVAHRTADDGDLRAALAHTHRKV